MQHAVPVGAIDREADGRSGPSALPRRRGRISLVRDVAVFQFKLMLDGFRDLVMSPMSFGAAIIGILAGGRDPYWAFRGLMAAGRESDRWINLFGAFDSLAGQRGRTVDATIDDIEEMLRRDYADGGVTARTRASVEAGLERLRAEMSRQRSANR